jgi:VIT1/CCC1 family predicted Fe2+/Mn2+ transporter
MLLLSDRGWGRSMADGQAAPAEVRTQVLDRKGIAARLDEERRRAGRLGEVREAIFGAQDGLVSTLAVVSTVSGATDDRFAVLIAGIATALAGIFSMAAGEYLSSKSQREVALAQIAVDREKVATQRLIAQAELAYMLEEEGLRDDEASVVAAIVARHPEVLLTTKVEKEFGLAIEESSGSPLQGALVMGAAFGLGALAPILPYLLLPVNVASLVAIVATGAVLFAIGVVKTRWTNGNPIFSGLEILLVGAFAGVVGFLFGNILPAMLGAPAAAG